jgi:hypothetical protein
MRKLDSLFLLLIVLAVSGCGAAWKKIPAAPEYTHAAPIPLKVGVILLQEDTTSFKDYHGGDDWPGLEAIKGLKEMQLFDSLIYPYEGGRRCCHAVNYYWRVGRIRGSDGNT